MSIRPRLSPQRQACCYLLNGMRRSGSIYPRWSTEAVRTRVREPQMQRIPGEIEELRGFLIIYRRIEVRRERMRASVQRDSHHRKNVRCFQLPGRKVPIRVPSG